MTNHQEDTHITKAITKAVREVYTRKFAKSVEEAFCIGVLRA